MTTASDQGPFSSAREDKERAAPVDGTPQTRAPSYKLAFADPDFLLREDLRSVRLQLELLKPELLLQEQGVRSTVAIFGSARIPERAKAEQALAQAEEDARAHPADEARARKVARARRTLESARYYEEARRLAAIVSATCIGPEICDFVILTGGGPGIMEAANRGAAEAGAKSVGLNIVLPHEQAPNRYVTPELCFRFHYFAIRKMHFLQRAKALVFFPGGFGTMDEMFEAATLMQTGKIEKIPFLLFGREFWERAIDLPMLVEEGLISESDPALFHYVETAEEAWHAIADFWKIGATAKG
jgi:uncharacterized protein (TIGR00730 family)